MWVLLALAAGPVGVAAGEPQGDAGAAEAPSGGGNLLVDGPLSEVTPHLHHLLQLALHDGALTLDRGRWVTSLTDVRSQRGGGPGFAPPHHDGRQMNDVRAGGDLFRHIIRQARLGGTSSSTHLGGPDGTASRRTVRGSGNKMDAEIDVHQTQLTMRLNERASPYRRMLVRERPDSLEITITDGGHATFQLLQTPHEGIQVLLTDGGGHHHIRADNFEALLDEHEDFYRRQLSPLLDALGVAMPVTRRDERVQSKVLAALAPAMGETGERARELIGELDHPDFRRRREAQQAIERRFEQYRAVLVRSLLELEQRPGVEARAFLDSQLRADDPDGARLIRFIHRQRLLEDEAWLEALRPQIEDAGDTAKLQRLNDHLDRLRGEDGDANASEPERPSPPGRTDDAAEQKESVDESARKPSPAGQSEQP